MSEQANAQRKAELLSKKVEHIDIRSFDARPIIDQMANMSFTSRDLARATGTAMPLTSLCAEIHRLLTTAGLGAMDQAALMEFWAPRQTPE